MKQRSTPRMARRVRKPNFTYEETMTLLEQIEFHKRILFGKSTNYQRAELWMMIANIVNAIPNSVGRTVEELKHRWKDLSLRARTAAREFQEAKVNPNSVTPSIYYHVIMKIVGEDLTEGKQGSTPVSDNSQNSVSHNDTEESMDVKPDISQINSYMCFDNPFYKPIVSMAETSPDSIVPVHDNGIERCQNIDKKNDNREGSSISSQVFPCVLSALTDEKAPRTIDNPVATKEAAGKLSRRKCLPRSLKQLNSSNLASRSHMLLRQSPLVSASHSRKFSLDTQQILEMDDPDLESESSDDAEFSPGLVSHKARPVNCTRNQEMKDKTQDLSIPSPNEPVATPNLETHPAEGSSLMSLSLEDLQKLYMVKKIHMIEQRTSCYKLLEKKIGCEMQALQTPHWTDKWHLPDNSSILPIGTHNFSQNNHMRKRMAPENSVHELQNSSHNKRRKDHCGFKQVAEVDAVFEDNDNLCDNVNGSYGSISSQYAQNDEDTACEGGDSYQQKLKENLNCVTELEEHSKNKPVIAGSVEEGESIS